MRPLSSPRALALLTFSPGLLFGQDLNLTDAPQTKPSNVTHAIALPMEETAELVTQRFEDGQTHIERWVALDSQGNFVNHGEYRQYSRKQNVVMSGKFEMGRRVGTWQQQLDRSQAANLVPNLAPGFKGPFESLAEFKNGQLNGQWRLADSEGRIVFTWDFQDDQRQGKSSWFDAQGEVVQLIEYHQNQPHGIGLFQVAQKEELERVNFEYGKAVKQVVNYYGNPRVRNSGRQSKIKSQEVVLKPSRLVVAEHDWVRSTVRMLDASDEQSVLHGRVVRYYENGQRMMDGQYDHGQKHGTFAWWFPNGQQQAVGEFQYDEATGKWSWWHDNGMKKAIGSFNQGEPTGTWLAWDVNGQRLQGERPTELRAAKRISSLDDSSRLGQ